MVSLGNRVRDIKLSQVMPPTVDNMLEAWWSQWESIFYEVAPIKQFPWQRNNLPWMTDDITDPVEKRDGVLRQLKKPGLNQQTKFDLATDLKLLRKQVKTRIRRTIIDQGTAALARHNHKEAWNFIKSATFIVSKCKEYYLDASALNDYFATIVHSPSDSPVEPMSGCDAPDCF
jgi:hypothetical protein